jgi:hypothetical protein
MWYSATQSNIDITAAIATRNEDCEAIITFKRLEQGQEDQEEEVIYLSMRKSDLEDDEPTPAPPSSPSMGMYT